MAILSKLSAAWHKFQNVSSTALENESPAEECPCQSKVPVQEMVQETINLASRISIAENQVSSPLLRLPAELRNQIYAYVDLGGQTIEVSSKSRIDYKILDEKSPNVQHNRTCPHASEQRLFYRIELSTDCEWASPSSDSSLSVPPSRRRCASINGLFALPQVCRQLHAETTPLLYQRNTFAFSDWHYNYTRSFPLFTQSLNTHQRAAIHSICWPLRQAREVQHSLSGARTLHDPDRACAEEFRSLVGLKKVTLRYVATDVGKAALSPSERDEFRRICEQNSGWGYAIEMEFRRRLAVRGLKELVGKADLNVECEKTWRAAF